MYIFRTLIFVGIISLSTCRPETQSPMQTQEEQQTKPNVLQKSTELPSKQQFNATAYFRDVWYVISAFYPQSNEREDKTACIKITSQILDNGNAKEVYTYLFEPKADFYLEAITNHTEFQNGIGKFIAETKSVDKEGNTMDSSSPVRTTIIDTDYSNYSVEYRCILQPISKPCIYLILNRTPYVLDPNVEPILNKLELKLQDFTLLTKPDCAEA